MSELGLQQGRRLDLDLPVGSITEKDLTLTVSARGPQVILKFFNKKAGRGFEVGFSPKSLDELEDHLKVAKRKVRGTAHG